MEALSDTVKMFVKSQVPAHSYRMWIEPLDLQETKSNHVAVLCPNVFSKKRIEEHYGKLIESAIKNFLGDSCKINLEISEHKDSDIIPAQSQIQLALPNMDIQPSYGRMLRKNFTFDRFIVGDSNNFAYSASLAMASENIMHQNALLLLSRTGLGKSHLSQAIGHQIMKRHPSRSVYYITADDFTNEMVTAFRQDSIQTFKEKYRNKCDVLIMEDVHFLTGKDRTQIELAMSLDYLFDLNKKIIFTSCCLPSEIPKMNDQLKSRLSCGLIPTIDPPDFKMRVKILRERLKEHHDRVPNEVTEYLASQLTENVRQLESGLMSVLAKSSLLNKPVDLALAESVTKTISKKSKAITIDVIKAMVCSHYSITVEDIISRSRKKSVAYPRHVAIYLSRRYTNQSLQAIGKSFNRYHATAIRSINEVERGIKENHALQKQVNFFCDKLESGEF